MVQLTYNVRLALLKVLDCAIVLSSIYFSYYLVSHPDYNFAEIIVSTSFLLIISHFIFATIFKLYYKSWEYASTGELLIILYIVTLSIISAVLFQLIIFKTVYFRTLVITWMLNILLIGGSRFIWRMFRDHVMNSGVKKKRTLIIGAGAAGEMVARQLLNSNESELKPVAFLDDDVRKRKIQIHGVPVIGSIDDIGRIVKEIKIEHIIIAIPSMKRKRLNEVFENCSNTGVKTQIIPRIEDILMGNVSVTHIRDVQVEDLLGRDPISLDTDSISNYITNKTVLITGAGGSIGSEISRQVATFNPNSIILLGHGENSIYEIDRQLRHNYANKIQIIPIIADIKDRKRIFEVVQTYRPDVIYHAAAHKHVPLMEYNPQEAVKNNIFGTKNVADAAQKFGVGTFVLVSTDKAVNPTNVMGATKRVAEMIIQNLSQKSITKFCAVRFGNVLGSRGSVIPLFKEQIKNGGPVTVTHPEMTRYFMTIPEASQLVIQAGAIASGGEIFVLDMGEPVRIVDLAKNLIKLSGYSLEDIPIKFTGIRPGEKMFEELLNEDEVQEEQVFPKIYVGKATFDKMKGIEEKINNLLNATNLKESLLEIIDSKDISKLDKVKQLAKTGGF